MTRLQAALGYYVVIDVKSNTPIRKELPFDEEPEIGARWGRPSSFAFSAANRPPGDSGTHITIVGGTGTKRREIHDIEVEIQRDEVRIFYEPGHIDGELSAVATDITWTKKINLDKTISGVQRTRLYDYNFTKVSEQ